ncbi:MAG: RNA polymerase factor sigma-54 [Balneolales bacterium]
MISSHQHLGQQQKLQQRISPQQIQYIKLLQLSTAALEKRIEEELENNPLLEEANVQEADEEEFIGEENEAENEDTAPVDRSDNAEWDTMVPKDEWETFTGNSLSEGYHPPGYTSDEPWQDIPRPYRNTLLEALEEQVNLLDLEEDKKLIADQIIGSIEEDGYLRRDLGSIIDSVAYNSGSIVKREEAEEVLRIIQRLDPPGIAARDLRECLLIQLEVKDEDLNGSRDLAFQIIQDYWELFEKKHFDKLQKKLNVSDESLKHAFHLIKLLDPKPGNLDESTETGSGTENYIIPDFNVIYRPKTDKANEESLDEDGEFIITLNDKNVPSLRISPRYVEIWNSIIKGKKTPEASDPETQNFIKDKIDSAKWFIDGIRQRQSTLMSVMRAIVSSQKDFFSFGGELKPMILKDVAEKIRMDISTVSRVASEKFVQTPFGVYPLKYFFNEAIKTQDGKEVSSRAVKKLLQNLVENEDQSKPLSDEALTVELENKGYKIARRTVSKYREQLHIPVARLRKNLG